MFFARAEARAVEMFPGVVRRTLGWGDRLLVAEFSYEPGARVPMHRHAFEQYSYVVEGEYTVTIAGARRLVRTGDSYLVPPDVDHAQEAAMRTVTCDVWCPPRPDYQDRKLPVGSTRPLPEQSVSQGYR